MQGTIVGVLRGGPSNEHDASLLSGHAVVSNLPRDQFTVKDIYIDKQGAWHERGKVSMPVDILRTIDVAVIAMHGKYAQDGEVQKLLERMNIPYTGSDSLNSSIAMHKVMAKERAKAYGIKTPKYLFVEEGSMLDDVSYNIVRTMMQPVVIKPARGGSPREVSIVSGFGAIHDTLEALFESSHEALVEEYIRGASASVGVINKFRNEELYALPPVEVVPAAHQLSIVQTAGMPGTYICPGRFSKEITDTLLQHAKTMHHTLGMRHYSRSNFIISPRGIYYLETNSLPQLSRDASFSKSLQAVGAPFSEFVTHIVGLALAE